MFDPPTARPGRERPRRDRVLNVRVTADGLAALEAFAEREGRTRSDAVRILLRRGLEAR